MDNFVNVNEVKIAYMLTGRGQPLLFLHGLMCNRQFWKLEIYTCKK
jgi:pimeloyl-ACP methyl ester carboxylesterase